MINKISFYRWWYLSLLGILSTIIFEIFLSNRYIAFAQSNIIPDETLGGEKSQVLSVDSDGLSIDSINGGATRGSNLFHSFKEFNVGEGRFTYFLNNDNNLQNIITRVTGNNPSNILGTLGIFNITGITSKPDLYLINPNGIVFGENARLDVAGSFVATTADGIEFGEQGVFSATNPEAPALLSVNPSALFFNQVANQGNITNLARLRGFNGETNITDGAVGLQVPNGKTVALVGRNVLLDDGNLTALAGRVEIGSVIGKGKVELNQIEDGLAFNYDNVDDFGEIRLENTAVVDVTAVGAGSINVTGKDINILGESSFRAGIKFGSNSTSNQAGNINLNATGKVEVDNSFILNSVNEEALGNSGEINITTDSLFIKNGAQIQSDVKGNGNSGLISIFAKDIVSINGTNSDGNKSGIFSSVNSGAIGNSGGINIISNSTYVTNNSRLYSFTYGSGNSGNVSIESEDLIVENSQAGTASFNSGKAGNFIIKATNFVNVKEEIPPEKDGELGFPGGLFTVVGVGGNGAKAGLISIETNRLSVSDGSKIQSTSFGVGESGNIKIKANEIDILDTSIPNLYSTGIFAGLERDARNPNNAAKGKGGNITIETERLSMLGNTDISSDVDENRIGDAGDIKISTNNLLLIDGASILTSTESQGNAGNIFINSRNIEMNNTSVIASSIKPGGIGKGGNIKIQTDSLSLFNSSQINSFISSQGLDREGNPVIAGNGDSGKLNIIVSDKIIISGMNEDGFSSAFFTFAERGTSGSPGDIFVQTDNLQIKDGGIIAATTANNNDAGNIFINAKNFEAIDGGQIVSATRSSGKAGTINFINPAGNIKISGFDLNFQQELNRAREFIKNNPSQRFKEVSDIVINEGANSGIFANTASNSTGNGGIINLQGNSISINDAAQITAQSLGSGEAGDINITLGNILQAEDGDITTTSEQSSGGAINITAKNIRLFGDSNIRTDVASGEGGGNITLMANSIVALDDSDIFSFARDGKGGDITFNTNGFFSTPLFFSSPQITDAETLESLDKNNQVDVNASGIVNGAITGIPDVTFIDDELTDLPDNQIDTNNLIANSCIARSNKRQENSFTITGSGGLRNRPGDGFVSTYSTGDVRTISEKNQSSEWKKGEPIIEPQGVYRLSSGELILSREC